MVVAYEFKFGFRFCRVCGGDIPVELQQLNKNSDEV